MISRDVNSTQEDRARERFLLSVVSSQLKDWFALQILEALHYDQGVLAPNWWIDFSNSACPSCGKKKYRIRIKAHPDSPFYACLDCGVVETWWELTKLPA